MIFVFGRPVVVFPYNQPSKELKMNRSRLLLAICSIALLGGCVTSKQWSEDDSRREAGLVKLAYEYKNIDIIRLEKGQGDQLAAQLCREWDFTGAEAVGETTKKCIKENQSGGCVGWKVSAIYKCTGTGVPISK
jgi:hypothetical protein